VPLVLPLLPAAPGLRSTTGGDWCTSPPWFPPDLLVDLPPALEFGLFWHQIPESKSKRVTVPRVFMSEATQWEQTHTRCIITHSYFNYFNPTLSNQGTDLLLQDESALKTVAEAPQGSAVLLRDKVRSSELSDQVVRGCCRPRAEMKPRAGFDGAWKSAVSFIVPPYGSDFLPFSVAAPARPWYKPMTTHREGRYWTSSGEEKR